MTALPAGLAPLPQLIFSVLLSFQRVEGGGKAKTLYDLIFLKSP